MLDMLDMFLGVPSFSGLTAFNKIYDRAWAGFT